jgi:hypothetical protein
MSFSTPSEKGMLISKVKRWINQAQAIPQNSTLSLQVLHDIQTVTGAKLCIGENPLTASSFFPSSWNSVTEKEGWMDKEDDWKSVLILLPTLQPSAQHNACNWISMNTIQHWFIVTNGATTIPSCLGSGICKIMDLDPEAPILRKHTGAFVRQQWESKPSKLTWSIWCSLQIPRETQHQIRSSLSSLSNRWTRRGVVQQMKDSPFYREAKFTEEGYLYEVAKYVAGSVAVCHRGTVWATLMSG